MRSITQSQLIKTLQSNIDLKNKLRTKVLPDIKRITVPVAEGFFAQVKLLLPPKRKPGDKYPMIVHVSGVPGFQTVDSR